MGKPVGSARRRHKWLALAFIGCLSLPASAEAGGIPAFARKYNLSCNTCHTRQPRLNWYGQRFLENDYQLPGTEDGGTTGKTLLGDLTLDEVRNFLGVRIRANTELFNFHDEEATEANEDFNIQAPDTLSVFMAGTAMKNVGYFLEMEFNTREEEGLIFERAFVALANLGGSRALNVKVGQLDPSFMFSFPTHRQQLNPVGADAETEDFPPEINRIPLLPLAFSAKFFGLTRGVDEGEEGFAILPFEPVFFNDPALKGAMLYGRPVGGPLFYQVGVVQSDRADGENGFDYYGMLRWDVIWRYAAANVSSFYYFSGDSANLTLNDGTGPVPFTEADWARWGIGARLNYKAWDLYGTWIHDELDFDLPTAGPPSRSEWDDTASGFTLQADWLASENWLLSARYDQMDAGGLVRLPNGEGGPAQDSSWLALQGKYYLHPNVAVYVRHHVNLKSGEESPARNLRHALLLGLDMAF